MPALTVDEIKAAIAKLTDEDRASLASWLNVETMDDWDREMQRDLSPGGKGMKFVQDVKRDVAEGLAEGTIRPIEEGFARRRT